METIQPVSHETFIQPGAFSSYTTEQWKTHIRYLQEVGFQTIIIQWSCVTKENRIISAFYPCRVIQYLSEDYREVDVIGKLLQACAALKMHVRMGLNNPDEWFSFVFSDMKWCRKEAEIGIAVARDIYEQYFETFHDVLVGWYFVPEYFNGMKNAEGAAELLNRYLDGLDDLNSSLPLMLSPFLRAFVSPEETRNEWIDIFQKTHFRRGDIFCCQDSVGAGWIGMFQLPYYFSALREAVDTKPELRFWANNEDFTQDGGTARLVRFIRQMEISRPYVEDYVTFSYDHYWSPDFVNPKHHEQYLRYFQTGHLDVEQYEEPMAIPVERQLLTRGCSYTGFQNTRGDEWDDDGVKLTNGIVPSADGSSPSYSACKHHHLTITVDLGKRSPINEIGLYLTFGNWGVALPSCTIFSVSENGMEWKPFGEVSSDRLRPVAQEKGWFQMYFGFQDKEGAKARYLRYEICGSGALWLGQLCAYFYKTGM